jgi:hypothetical protein
MAHLRVHRRPGRRHLDARSDRRSMAGGFAVFYSAAAFKTSAPSLRK